MKTNTLDITEIPFSKLLNLALSDKKNYLLMLDERAELHNHLDMLHAGVLFTVAESTSGEFLLRTFNNLEMDILPVIRKAEIKYNKPGRGKVYSNAKLISPAAEEVKHELQTKGRVLITVQCDVFNLADVKLLRANFDWFVARR